MVAWKSACGALLLLVVAVHTQQENDRDATDEVLDEIPWEDIPTQNGRLIFRVCFASFWATFKMATSLLFYI